MRTIAMIAVLAGIAAAQPSNQVAAAPAVGASGARPAPAAQMPLMTIRMMEKDFDAELAKTGAAGHPLDILGLTRGLYLSDYGVVFTAEVSLILTPTLNPFRSQITPAQMIEVHNLKVQNVPLLKKAMHDWLRAKAMTFSAGGVAMGFLRSNTQMVLAVRLSYLPYENTVGLPGLIVMKTDPKSASADDIKVEEQF